MSARSSRFSGFGSRRRRGKAAGAVFACAVMLLAGCGGSGGSAADASAPVVRGDAPVAAFSVTFAAEGGTGSMIPQVASTATALTPIGTLIQRNGYAFGGWATTVTGPMAYADGAVYPFTANATLHARWMQVAFKPGGATEGSMIPQFASTPTALTMNAFTWPGHKFEGWAKTGSGPMEYADGAVFPFTERQALFARWLSVEFVANGGSGTMPMQGAYAPTALTMNAFTWSGFVFDGWATTPSGSKAYADGALYAFPTAAKLYARFRGVVFVANGGTGTIPAQDAVTTTALNQNTFTKAGYVFDGWATTQNGSKAYADGASYPFPEKSAANLYARWRCADSSVAIIKKRRSGKNAAIVTYLAQSGESPWNRFVAQSDEGQATVLQTSSNSESITVLALRQNTPYNFTVTGYNEAGCSYTSASVQVEKSP